MFHAIHGPLPVDETPYNGPDVEHYYMQLDVSPHINPDSQSTAESGQDTRAEQDNTRYPELYRLYKDGLVLLSLSRVHAIASGHLDSDVSTSFPCYGIFLRYPNAPSSERWQLRIERSLLEVNSLETTRIVAGTSRHSPAHTQNIMDTICRCTATGGRLICILAAQNVPPPQRMFKVSTKPDIGVDLFFNTPQHPDPTQYIYHCVNTPIEIVPDRFKSEINFDFREYYSHYVNRGYRLVEIFHDHSRAGMPKLGRFPADRFTMDTIWFFEKEASRADDNSPMYVGCIVESYVHVKVSFLKGVEASSNMTELLKTMSQKRWEFVCSLETPKVVQKAKFIRQTVLLFFQRKILSAPTSSGNPTLPPVTDPVSTEPMAPPSYDAVVKQMPAGDT